MYNNIKLEKGLYSITGKTFTQALAELDPDATMRTPSLKVLTLLKDSSSVLTSR